MAARRKGLGRGLDALLSVGTKHDETVTPSTTQVQDAIEEVQSPEPLLHERLQEIPIEWVQRGKYQPRRDIHQETLEELAASIKSQGLMQPIVVRPLPDSENRYEIIAGERRWRACQLLGFDHIKAIIRDIPDEAAIAMALIENIQREDLNPLEEALALKRLQDEFELTHQQVAEAVGKSRTNVTNLLRLLALDEEVKKLLEYGDIEMGHARALLPLDELRQRQCAAEIVSKSLSVRQTESLVRRLSQDNQAKKENKPAYSQDIQQLEQGLSEKIGVPTMIQHNVKGKGRLVLKYNNLDELDGILQHLGYSSD